MKHCIKCLVELTTENCNHNQNWSVCNTCEREYGRNWHREYCKSEVNKEKSRELDRLNYQKNKDRENTRDRELYQLNKERYKFMEKQRDELVGATPWQRVMAQHLEIPAKYLTPYEIHHIDQNRENNIIENLLLLSRKAHRVIHGHLKKEIRPIQTVYLAGPLEAVSKEYAMSWRNEVYDYLASIGIIALVPGKEQIELSPRQIVQLDITMIDNSDAVLVNLDFLNQDMLLGTGTLAELGMCYASDKIVIGFTFGEKLKKAKFAQGILSNYFTNLQTSLKVLESINCGIETNGSRRVRAYEI